MKNKPKAGITQLRTKCSYCSGEGRRIVNDPCTGVVQCVKCNATWDGMIEWSEYDTFGMGRFYE